MPSNGISLAEQEMTEAELGSVRAATRMNVPNGTTAAGQHTLSLGKRYQFIDISCSRYLLYTIIDSVLYH
jgi:hypothetical protein